MKLLSQKKVDLEYILGLVSEHPLIVNLLKCSKQCTTMQKRTFTPRFHYFILDNATNFPMQLYFKSQEYMLNHCLPMLGILTIILTIIPQKTANNSNALRLKTKSFPENFIAFVESTANAEYFQKKLEPHSLNIFEIILSEKCRFLNA